MDVVGHANQQQQVRPLRSEADPAGEIARSLPEQMAAGRIAGEKFTHLPAVRQREIGRPACRRSLRHDLGDAYRHGDAPFDGIAGEPVVSRKADRNAEGGAERFICAKFARLFHCLSGRNGDAPLRLFRPEPRRSAEFQCELRRFVKRVGQLGREPVRFPR